MKKRPWSSLSEDERDKLVKKYQKTTGPDACDKMGVKYSTARNRLWEIAPKGMGHGGARPGSGNKPGVKWCAKCKKKVENCKCF